MTCNCELCQISHVLQALKPRCTEEENRLLERMWDRMETAETELSVRQGREERGA